jgi:hypothetical protein
MYKDQPRGVLLIDTVLRNLERTYEDNLWNCSANYNDPDMRVLDREINRLKEAQQKGEMYDPVF